jgi:hypothetical protein
MKTISRALQAGALALGLLLPATIAHAADAWIASWGAAQQGAFAAPAAPAALSAPGEFQASV